MGDVRSRVEALLGAVCHTSEADARARAVGVLEIPLELGEGGPVHSSAPALAIEAVVALDRLGHGARVRAEHTALSTVLHELREHGLGDRAVGTAGRRTRRPGRRLSPKLLPPRWCQS